MSQKINTYPGSNRGFSLTELLVAMTILVTVMGGIGALYAGAVRSFNTGKVLSKNFENSRSLLNVLSQDLSNAFSAAEFGDQYKFHGTKLGFTFVGVNSSNKIGRITYVTNPNANPLLFETQTMKSYAATRNTVQNQTRNWLIQNGVLDNNTREGAVSGVGIIFDNVFNTGAPFPDNLTPDTSGDFSMEFDVLIQTQGILRYGEFDVSGSNDAPAYQDLNTFSVTTQYGQNLLWPYVDPYDSDNDQPDRLEYSTPLNVRTSDTLYGEILNALFVQDQDLRLIIEDFNDLGDRLNNIDNDLVEKIISIKRRELWIRWLADDPTLVNDQGLPRFWSTNPDDTNDYRPDLRDYIISDDILYRSRIKTPGGTFLDVEIADALSSVVPDPVAPLILNTINIPGAFQYASSNAVAMETFNDTANIVGYTLMRASTDNNSNLLQEWDQALFTELTLLSTQTGASGSPLKPGLPAIVQPGIFITTEKVTPGSPDFSHWFSQQVEIHAGSDRSMPSSVIANQDQS